MSITLNPSTNHNIYGVDINNAHIIELVLAFLWFLFYLNIYWESYNILEFLVYKKPKKLLDSLNVLQYYIILINIVAK